MRRDLEFTHRHTGAGDEVIVYDPVACRYFRAGELEATLFALLDGETPVEEVAAQMARAFPRLPPEEIPAFVEQIGRLGFLEGSTAVPPPVRPPFYHYLLYFQVRFGNPERLFARLLPYVGWLYRPAGWALAALLILAAGAVASASREELYLMATAADSGGFWLQLWLGLVLIGTIHEFGHGLTCTYFGGRSQGIGFLWLYGLPCLYCDVSGAWTLPRKSQRIWVGAAGLYYQFLAGATALLIWRVLEPGSVASHLLWSMAASCGLLSLINLNPLVRLDGYYLLSDWLEIPNLRRRAFATLGEAWAKFWLGQPSAGAPLPAGERRLYLSYATLAALFTGWLVAGLVWQTGGFLTGRFGGTGAILLLLPVGMVAGPAVARAAAVAENVLRRWGEVPGLGRRRLLCAAAVIALLPPVLAWVPWELRLTSECRLEATARGPVRARVAGRVATISVREGERVKRGQVLGRLDTLGREQQRAERETQLRMLRLEIRAREERLQTLAAEREQLAAEAASAAKEARARLAEARATLGAQRRVAARLRHDAHRAARGAGPPALASARELWQQRLAEREITRDELSRVRRLVAVGALPRQHLAAARGRDSAASRRAAEAAQLLAGARKGLREAAEDARAALERQEAQWMAASAASALASAAANGAHAAARLVGSARGPDSPPAGRRRAASADTAFASARAARGEANARRAELTLKRLEATRLAGQLAFLAEQIRRCDLIAPCDGIVTTPRPEEAVGAFLGEGAMALEVEDTTSLATRIFLSERDLGEIRTGQRVALRVAAFPDKTYHGRVSEIAPRAVPAGSDAFPTRIVEVRLRVENRGGALRPGMTGWAKIECGSRPLGAVLLRRVQRYLRTEVWSWF